MRSSMMFRNAACSALLVASLALPVSAAPRPEPGWASLWERFTVWVAAVLAPAPGIEKIGPMWDPFGTPSAAGEECTQGECLNSGPMWDPLG
jgi:hypothetical protein